MAKKRHHHEMKRHERDGMERHDEMNRPRGGEYMRDTMGKPRMEHGIMFHEDMTAPALMPREVRDQYWPKSYSGPMGVGMIDDLFEGAQKQMHRDRSDMDRIMDPKKY